MTSMHTGQVLEHCPYAHYPQMVVALLSLITALHRLSQYNISFRGNAHRYARSFLSLHRTASSMERSVWRGHHAPHKQDDIIENEPLSKQGDFRVLMTRAPGLYLRGFLFLVRR